MAEGGKGKEWGGDVRKGKGKLGRETIERSKPPILYCLIPYGVKNKAGYTATPVACGWAGAMLEVSGALWQKQ